MARKVRKSHAGHSLTLCRVALSRTEETKGIHGNGLGWAASSSRPTLAPSKRAVAEAARLRVAAEPNFECDERSEWAGIRKGKRLRHATQRHC